MSEDLGNTSVRVLQGEVLLELVEQRQNHSLRPGDSMQVGGGEVGRGGVRKSGGRRALSGPAARSCRPGGTTKCTRCRRGPRASCTPTSTPPPWRWSAT